MVEEGNKRRKLLFKKEKKLEEGGEKSGFIKDLRIAYRNLEDFEGFIKKNLLPSLIFGIFLVLSPFTLSNYLPIALNPIAFPSVGLIIIVLGVLYPYINWKNKENEINGKMHFFITHLRVLAISDLSLKDIINTIGEKRKVYKSLGDEIRKISILSTQWKVPLARAFRFISERTPSKMLRDFLDRFSQSLVSGVSHREFIEQEQGAVMEEYKTMYESANENLTILNEVYVSLLISIVFVMSFGLVLPMIMGAADMNTFVYGSAFALIATEGLLLYLLKSMMPADEIWPQTGEKSEIEKNLYGLFFLSIIVSVILGIFLFYLKFSGYQIFSLIPNEIFVSIALTPLIIPGIKTFIEEQNIFRRERNFLGFLPALGSISAMKGGKINESVKYLSEKDYGILTPHIRNLYKRLSTRIDDDAAWEWFGVDTCSNYIQRGSEMFREATYAAANPRDVARMITENIRKIRDLRLKKLSIIKTTVSLFLGITFGIAFSIYVSLVIAQHLNEIWLEAGEPFKNLQQINIGAILTTVPPQIFSNIFYVVFLILIIHCLILSLTIKELRGSHLLITLLYFVPMVWIVSITSFVVTTFLGCYI